MSSFHCALGSLSQVETVRRVSVVVDESESSSSRELISGSAHRDGRLFGQSDLFSDDDDDDSCRSAADKEEGSHEEQQKDRTPESSSEFCESSLGAYGNEYSPPDPKISRHTE